MDAQFTGPLVWTRIPKTRPREFALSAGSHILARLRWQKTVGSHAVGETTAGNWSFKRTGFLSTRVSVRAVGTDEEFAVFYPSMWGGGRIDMRDRQSWFFRPKGFLSSRYELNDTQGRVVLSLALKRFGEVGELQFESPVPADSTASLLALTVWYVSLLNKEDAEAAAVIACCS